MSAAFVLLKVLRSDFYADLAGPPLMTTIRKVFHDSILALRRMSVAANDLPSRVSDVLTYLYKHPDPRVVCAPGPGGLQLDIRSRMSMSIVYDSLWRWRDTFRSRAVANGDTASEARENGKSKP
jgi:transcriptional regulatory protein LEU3